METIIIFTRSYPFNGSENSFLQEEIKHLLAINKKIVLIPTLIGGELCEFSKEIYLDKSLGLYLEKFRKKKYFFVCKSFFSYLLFKEIILKPVILIRPNYLIRLIFSIANILYLKGWIKNNIVKNIDKREKVILYTYWFTNLTTALGLTVKNKNNFFLITRAHGADLYEERNIGYIPLRKQALSLINYVFFVSEHGLNYAKSKYPNSSPKFELAELGVKDSYCLTNPSYDNVFRIVSCSSVTKIKRVELLLEGIIEFSKLNINKNIIWTHFGDGILLNDLLKLVEEYKPNNLECHIKGFTENIKLLEYYKSNPVDVFISTSSSEGGRPVSMQEAQSFGIPIIATSVGGIPEIVTENNGLLLPSNPKVKEIAEALNWFFNNPQDALKKRILSRTNWEQNYNSDINFKKFSLKLQQLANL